MAKEGKWPLRLFLKETMTFESVITSGASFKCANIKAFREGLNEEDDHIPRWQPTNDNARNNRKTGAVIVEPIVDACGDE